MEIFHSVGVNCKNDQFDVALVKHLLSNSFFNNKTLNTTLSFNREAKNISLTDKGLNFSSGVDGFYTSIITASYPVFYNVCCAGNSLLGLCHICKANEIIIINL